MGYSFCNSWDGDKKENQKKDIHHEGDEGHEENR